MNKSLFLFNLFLSLSLFSIAQDKSESITEEQTIEYLNKKLGKDIQFEIAEGKLLIIKFFKNSTLYKIDNIYLQTIDPQKISYSREEKVMVIRCLEAEELTGKLKKFKDGCVERELVDKKSIGAYGRSNLEVPSDSKSIEGIKNALVHLVKSVQDEEYQNNTPFEK